MSENSKIGSDALEQMYTTYYSPLYHLSYRMLGSRSEAEEVVQDVFLKVSQYDLSLDDSWKTFLWKMTTNRCIDVLKSARKKREQYIGPWLPEPEVVRLPVETNMPLNQLMRGEQISYAILVLMERLTPYERAVFLLREVYVYDYDEIAQLIGKSVLNCRKLLSRARNKLEDECIEGNKTPHDLELIRTEHSQLIQQFTDAVQKNDMDTLRKLCVEDITLYSDGGGKVKAALNPIHGLKHVGSFLISVSKKEKDNYDLEMQLLNGQQGLVFKRHNEVHIVMMFRISKGKFQSIFMQMNPDKLG